MVLDCIDGDGDTNLTVNIQDNDINETFTVKGLMLYSDSSTIDYESMEPDTSFYILTVVVEDDRSGNNSLSTSTIIYVQVS